MVKKTQFNLGIPITTRLELYIIAMSPYMGVHLFKEECVPERRVYRRVAWTQLYSLIIGLF